MARLFEPAAPASPMPASRRTQSRRPPPRPPCSPPPKHRARSRQLLPSQPPHLRQLDRPDFAQAATACSSHSPRPLLRAPRSTSARPPEPAPPAPRPASAPPAHHALIASASHCRRRPSRRSARLGRSPSGIKTFPETYKNLPRGPRGDLDPPTHHLRCSTLRNLVHHSPPTYITVQYYSLS